MFPSFRSLATLARSHGLLPLWILTALFSASPVAAQPEISGDPSPQILISARLLEFSRQDINADLGLYQNLFVQNDGDQDLAITNVEVSNPEFNIVNDTGESTIPPGDYRRIQIAFDPSSEGIKTGFLRIDSNSPGEEQLDVFLRGVGITGPEISYTPPGVLFSEVQLGTPAGSSIQIHNTGGTQLLIDETFLETSTGQDQVGLDFSLFALSDEDLEVDPGSFTAQGIQFVPVTPGFQGVFLGTTSNDPDEDPARAIVLGYTPNPIFMPSVAGLNFGRNPVDSEAGVPILSRIPVLNRLFTLSRQNSHTEYDAALIITIRPTLLNAFNFSEAEEFSSPPNTKPSDPAPRTITGIAPGEDVNLLVQYAPQEFGEHVAFLEITAVLTPAGAQLPDISGIDPDEIYVIPMIGELVAPGIANRADPAWSLYR